MLNKYRRLIFVTVFFICCCYAVMPQDLEALKNSPKYELVNDWPQLPDGYMLSQPGGIGIDTSQNIFVFHRPGRKWKLLEEDFPDSLISANTILHARPANRKNFKQLGRQHIYYAAWVNS